MAAIARLTKQTLTTNPIAIASSRSIATKRTLRKTHKGRMNGIANETGSSILFGDYALQALECSWITARQIEAGRRAVQRSTGKSGKVWVRMDAYKPITEKAIGVRMGSGKGAIQYSVAVVKPGRMLYEVGGVSENIARKAIALAAAKMPIRTAFRTRSFCSVSFRGDFVEDSQPAVEELKNTHEQISGLNLPTLLQTLDLNK